WPCCLKHCYQHCRVGGNGGTGDHGLRPVVFYLRRDARAVLNRAFSFWHRLWNLRQCYCPAAGTSVRVVHLADSRYALALCRRFLSVVHAAQVDAGDWTPPSAFLHFRRDAGNCLGSSRIDCDAAFGRGPRADLHPACLLVLYLRLWLRSTNRTHRTIQRGDRELNVTGSADHSHRLVAMVPSPSARTLPTPSPS